MQQFRRYVSIVLTLLIVSLGIAALGWYISGGRVYTVQTNSMRPAFVAGDAVLVHQLDANRLAVGDVITYRRRDQPNVIVSHRLISRQPGHGRFITRGDNNHLADPTIADKQVIGRVVAVGPHLGSFMHWLRSPFGSALAVYAPATSIVLIELWRLYYRLPSSRYQLRGR